MTGEGLAPLPTEFSDHAKRVIAACDLVRSEGYVVVSAVEHEMWSSWLRESNERNRKVHDEFQQALWQVGHLMDRCAELLGGRRPRWWRDAQRWWKSSSWTVPISYGRDGGDS